MGGLSLNCVPCPDGVRTAHLLRTFLLLIPLSCVLLSSLSLHSLILDEQVKQVIATEFPYLLYSDSKKNPEHVLIHSVLRYYFYMELLGSESRAAAVPDLDNSRESEIHTLHTQKFTCLIQTLSTMTSGFKFLAITFIASTIY